MQMTPRVPMPRFLLVEDDTISRGFFRAALETLPAQVETADSLASALERGRRSEHDLWLIDVNLPDGNGSQLLQGAGGGVEVRAVDEDRQPIGGMKHGRSRRKR